MAITVYVLSIVLKSNPTAPTLLAVLIASGGGALVYLGLCHWLNVEALAVVSGLVRTRFIWKR
jgi:hypothetical protein